MTAAALGTTLTLPTLEADVRAGRRLGRRDHASSSRSGPAPSPAPSRCCAGAACPGCAAAAATSSSPSLVETPTRLDPRQEELLRELAAIRGEEQPTGQVAARPASRSSAGCATRSTRTERSMSLPVHLVAVAGRRRRRVGRSRSTGDEAHHAVAVRRLRVGEPVVLTDGRGHVGDRRGGRRPASGSSR